MERTHSVRSNGYLILLAILSFILCINLLFYVADVRQTVADIGVDNTYIIVFLLAVIGGLSSITGPPLFATIVTFAAGGSDPLVLGVAGGAGLFISDSIFYHLFLVGRKSLPDRWESAAAKLRKRIDRLPSWAVLPGSYVYIGLTPLPNDLLMFALGISGYPYRKIAPILLAADLTLATTTAYLGEVFIYFLTS